MREADINTFMCRMSWKSGSLTSWKPLGHTGPVTGLLQKLLLYSETNAVIKHLSSREKIVHGLHCSISITKGVRQCEEKQAVFMGQSDLPLCVQSPINF